MGIMRRIYGIGFPDVECRENSSKYWYLCIKSRFARHFMCSLNGKLLDNHSDNMIVP